MGKPKPGPLGQDSLLIPATGLPLKRARFVVSHQALSETKNADLIGSIEIT
ncbi:MAG: hypothetical protein JEZ11_16525 [Desulfobacterales bacterium]|nr:hypothetical protein [Desulfobacterales bacterium]